MTKQQFDDLLPDGINPGMVVPFAHKGHWAVHELLPMFFTQIGAFNLRLATFNISEDSLRPIFFMKERGELNDIRFLFDNNVKRHKIDMLFFSSSIANQIRVSASHMKLLIASTPDISIVVAGSANMNRNIRHESGFIATDTAICDYFINYFDNVFENDSIPFLWN